MTSSPPTAQELAKAFGCSPAAIQDSFPCSAMQEGFIAQTSRGSRAPIRHIVLDLSPEVNLATLQSAVEQYVNLTDVLRTRIIDTEESGLIQVVLDTSFEWSRYESFEECAKAAKSFTWSLGEPLARYSLIVNTHSNHRSFVWTIHHAIYDGWSFKNMTKAVCSIYNGKPAIEVPPFRNFITNLQERSIEDAQKFWKDELDGLDSVIFPELPTQEYKPLATSTCCHLCPAIPKVEGVSRTALIRAALAIVIATHTGTNDVCFGTIVAGRDFVPKSTVGCTISTLPARLVLTDETRVYDLLRYSQTKIETSKPYEHLGLRSISRVSEEGSIASGFQTLLIVQPSKSTMKLDSSIGSWRRQEADHGVASQALTIQCSLEKDGIDIDAWYDSNVIAEWQVKRILQQLTQVIHQLAQSQEKMICNINVAINDDLVDIWRWNDSVPVSHNRCVHDLISDTARRRPDATAIHAWDGELTYRQLDELSNTVATKLVAQGVTAENVVPLLFEKSVWMPVAMLAVMKAGGICLAVDTTQPIERLSRLMGTTQPVVALASSNNNVLAHSAHAGTVMIIDRDTIEQGSTLSAVLSATNLSTAAYIQFTSGSTGVPKGVVVTHSNLCTFVQAGRERQLFAEDDRVLDFASYSFDVAWSNFVNTLVTGACLVVPSEDERRQDLEQAIQKYRTSYVHLTPTVARTIDPTKIPCLKKLNLGGEKVVVKDFENWRDHVEMVITYGPAEATITTTCAQLANGETGIGFPIASNAWIVKGNQLCPVGAIGELWLEGPLVSRGYLHDPERTDISFIKDPWWLLQGGPSTTSVGRAGKLYKTGDLVKYNPDGSLVYIRRKDDSQVKIRGQRVELGEVEWHVRNAFLAEMNSRGMATNFLHITADSITLDGNKRSVLVAFISISSAQDAAPLPQEQQEEAIADMTDNVNNELRAKVPTYMIPSMYVSVSNLAVSVAGKLDRRKLRASLQGKTSQELDYKSKHSLRRIILPETAVETQLIALWAVILMREIDSISADDNFFRIGGDSIDAMRLVSLARKSGLYFNALDVFEHARVCDLATIASTAPPTMELEVTPFSLLPTNPIDVRETVSLLCNVTADCIEDVLPCTSSQSGLMALTARREGDYIAKFTYNVRSDVDMTRLQQAWNDTIATTPILRTRIVNTTGIGLVQVVLKNDESLALHLTENSANSLKSIGMLGQPLLFARINTNETDHVAKLEVQVHHAVYDGWSLPKIIARVGQLYARHCIPKSPSFATFVHHTVNLDPTKTMLFWETMFDGLNAQQFPSLPSPEYHPYPSHIYRYDLTLPRGKTIATSSIAIRAAWAILLASDTGSDEAVFSAVVSGRQAAITGIEDILGPTLNTVPLRIGTSAELTVAEILAQVQQQAVHMIPYEQTGLQNIRQASKEAQLACDSQSLLIVHPKKMIQSVRPLLDMHEDHNMEIGMSSSGGYGTHSLALDCFLRDDGMLLQVTFDPVVISEKQIKRLAQRFELILRQICSETNQATKIEDIRLVLDEDLNQIWDWNQTCPKYIDGNVRDIIASTISRRPDSLAVDAWDGKLTYTQLDALSTKLAVDLVHNYGVGPEVVVPLVFEKSMFTPIAMLAVLKAGGASVALDISQPEERLHSIINQVSNMKVLVCSASNRTLASKLSAGPVIIVENNTLQQPPQTMGSSMEWPSIQSKNALYIIFTSGTTGIPKGVVITHGNFATAAQECYMKDTLKFTEDHRIFDFASYAFDVSWSNFLNAFSSGATLCIPSEDDRRSDIGLAIAKFSATYVDLTPTVAKLLEPSSVPSLRVLNMGGEFICFEDFRHWFADAQVLVTYGPSEVTICTTCLPIDQSSHQSEGIGHNFGTNAWIVNARGDALCPVGTVGELWLEGPFVGRGYLNNPEKTNAVFVEDPPWLLKGGPNRIGRRGRLYRTGDLVRYNDNGGLVFIGRRDQQTKIRGQRIELGEVEHHIKAVLQQELDQDESHIKTTTQINVMAEAVMLKGSSQVSLVAFINLKQGVGTSWTTYEHDAAVKILVRRLESQLRQRVPVYMIPTACIPLHEIALTATGKADKKKLQQLASSLTLDEITAEKLSSRELRQPVTSKEIQLAALWAEVLGRDKTQISIDDDFFQIGGNSIDAMRVVSAAQRQGIKVTVAQIFRTPQLSQLAAVARDKEPPLPVSKDPEPFSLLNSSNCLEEVVIKAASLCNVRAADIEDILPCTPLQEGLLALTARREGDYVATFSYELRSHVDLSRLGDAWNKVVAHIPILRTYIVNLPGEGMSQVILSSGEALEFLEKTPENYPGLSTEILGRPLSKATVLTNGENDGTFVWQIHHALYDGWSVSKIFDALVETYEGKSFPAIAPFGRFVKHITSIEGQDSFWKAQFDGLDAQTYPRLPSTDYYPQATEINRQCINLSDSTTKSHFTMATFLRATWAFLVASDSASNEAVFGAICSGRQATEIVGIEDIIGPTLATVPVRIKLEREQTVKHYLSQVQEQMVQLVPYEQTGLQRIRKASDDAEEACRFQSLLTINPAENTTSGTEIFKVSKSPTDGPVSSNANGFGSYAITIDCFLQASNSFEIQIAVDPQVVRPTEVDRIFARFESVLKQLKSGEHISVPLSSVIATSSADLDTIWKWNGQVPLPVDKCVHQLIAQSVRNRPDHVAVCAWDGQLTYTELDALSTQLAAHLIHLIDPESIVPLLFEKSYWTPVAMLAVMKAGGASVALDVNQPLERLRGIVRQVDPKVLLSSKRRSNVGEEIFPRGQVIIAEHVAALPVPPGSLGSETRVQPDNALYVVFTSGTTGTPKGITITHRNFSTAIRDGHKALCITEDARILDFASYAFDVSWSNVLNAFTAGATLCIPSEDERNDPAVAIARYDATWVELTPTVSKLFHPSAVPSLKVINLSGEAVLAEEFLEWTDSATLLVTYGPSECTITTTVARIDPKRNDPLDIGHALETCTWVVNRGELCPVGAIGELWLEGPLVGRGYLNNAEKTTSAFVTDPEWLLRGSASHPGRSGRLYRTGDLVRYNPNNKGGLIYCGRIDSQVKIRGQRVELDDVSVNVRNILMETALEICTSNAAEELTSEDCSLLDRGSAAITQIHVTSEAIVLLGSTRPSLISFVTLLRDDDNTWTEDEHNQVIYQLLKGIDQKIVGRVPAYMIPAAYVPMCSLTTATTGKTDRRKLRDSLAQMTLEQVIEPFETCHYVAPQSSTETELAALWSEVLGLEVSQISAADHFFYIGGDSIDAMRLVSMARERGYTLNVPVIFQKPRLCDLAQVLVMTTESVELTIQPFSLLQDITNAAGLRLEAARLCDTAEDQIEDIIPCTPLQKGLLALTERRKGDYIADFHYKLRPGVDVSRFKKAWEATVLSNPILRTRILTLDSEGTVQVVLKEERIFETNELQSGFVRQGSPLHASEIRADSTTGSKTFVLWLHHAVYDGWCLPMIIQAVETAYNQDGSLHLARYPFSGFVRYIQNIDKESQHEYWAHQFGGLDIQQFPQLPSPNYHPHSRMQYRRNTDFMLPVPAEFTLSTVIRAAWALVAAKDSDSSQAVFGAVVSGRQAAVPGVESMVGPTIATVPVRVSLQMDASVETLLKQIQDQSACMVPFEQTGLQSIRQTNHEAMQACDFQSLIVVQPGTDLDISSDIFEKIEEENTSDEEQFTSTEGFGTFALMVDFVLARNSLQILAAFDPAVLNEQAVRRLFGRFELVLRQVCTTEYRHTALSAIRTVTDQDLSQIWQWNEELPPALDDRIPERIAATVARYPHAIAVEAWDGSMTYTELDHWSTQVAIKLLEYGVRSGITVPLLFEKSMWMSVAMVAVVKAGGIGVGLDVTQPRERLSSITDQLNIIVTLTSDKNQQLSRRVGDFPAVVVSHDAIKSCPVGSFETPAGNSTDDLCVVFTSGSTGKPKGVPLTHRNFVTAIDCHIQTFGISSSSRIYDFASYSFDFAWSNLLLTMFSGCCLCVPNETERRDDPVSSMARFGVTFGFFTPALVQTFTPELLPTLQTLLVGGEKFRAQDLPKFGQSCEIWLVYGPSECTVLATSASLREIKDQQYTIGRGMATNTWIVSGEQLCPIGTVGELWLEGPLTGRGYYNNDEKTKEAFIDDPEWLARGAPGHSGRRGRLYKTGDLVKYESDGSILYVARKDSQVKVRGQRVELGEVDAHVTAALKKAIIITKETVLEPSSNEDEQSYTGSSGSSDSGYQTEDSPQPLDCNITVISEVVTLKGSTNSTLVSFINRRNKNCTLLPKDHVEAVRVLAKGIEDRLSEKVPAYMIPSAFIPLHTIPMTTTGKFDRKRLREIASKLTASDLLESERSRSSRYASTATEVILESIWKTVLNNSEALDVDTDFFRMGGDSITAMQVAAAARSQGLSVAVGDIQTQRTIAKLAATCQSKARLISKIENMEEKTEIAFPLSPIQQWFVDEHPEGNICFDICFFLELSRDFSTETLQQALAKVVSRHSMLRARFQKHTVSGVWTQRITNETDSSFKLTSVSDCPEDGLPGIFAKCRDAVDIEIGPLTSAVHIQDSGRQHLFLAINHLVSDLVSFRVIFQDLEDILSGKDTTPVHSLGFQDWLVHHNVSDPAAVS
ncbi:acetyl-CoA synthetase-like protein [Pseudovirgaria hyperparasitica]|uniref:Acetyl-CoA synthetase-like protein n=1 Tax=Pseudovirgaria hyperparasitica TaxID=470096 RepID=A0A6A6WGF3_9PEZI|nr:acetyl-CoA synthetase-like protein [Pseudovirgaria hyperparasitica]KAF2761932.1 acetyl-CoA synthetase-like protein [Pseudovirgaria hyperparasitica]